MKQQMEKLGKTTIQISLEKVEQMEIKGQVRISLQALASFLYGLDDTNSLWKSVGKHYNKQICFKNYRFEDVMKDNNLAKKWFKEQKKQWKNHGNEIIFPFIENFSNNIKVS